MLLHAEPSLKRKETVLNLVQNFTLAWIKNAKNNFEFRILQAATIKIGIGDFLL